MFFRILKLDLKKKKLMNFLLLLFIILASIFSASGLNNIITVMNGTDYYFDKAGIGNYAVFTANDEKVFEVLDNSSIVKSYKCEKCIIGSKSNVKIGDKNIETNYNIMFQAIETSSIRFFDKDDNEITSVEKGKVYLTGNAMEQNNLKEGDKLTIDLDGNVFDLTVAGSAKDAFMGSKFFGNKRLILNKEDYEQIRNYYVESSNGADLTLDVNIFYIETDNVNEMAKCLSEVSSVVFSGSRSVLKLCYVMDMIIAFVVLVLSVCLIIVALLILKFTITFTIKEEYREIGVMKAIGINNKSIKNLYIIKYLSLALVGAFIGLLISVPFGNWLLKSTTENMVLGNTVGVIYNIIGAIFVVIVTVLFAYIYTGKVKKATPVDAIRNGQTGERYKTKTIYKLKNSHIRINLYMAINDILSSPKRFITVIISFFVCLILVLGIVITTDTMKSKNLIKTFCTESDVYFMPTDANDMFKCKSKEDLEVFFGKYEKLLTEAGMPCTVCADLHYSNKVLFDGTTYNIRCLQGFNTSVEEYDYFEGIAPVKENEVAITDKISEMIGAKIGDVITIEFGNEQKEFIVTAYFQSLNNIGNVIRLNENTKIDYSSLIGCQMFQINFTDDIGEEEKINRIERVKEVLKTEDVVSPEKFCADNIGVADVMEAVQYFLLAITIIVVILVTLLMELSFVTNERSQIALLKAIGFKNIHIIKLHIYRFLIVTMVAEILAVIFALPITRAWCNPIFGMMGANNINFYINPIHIYLMYPGIVLIVTILTAAIGALSTNKIKSSDTANIE